MDFSLLTIKIYIENWLGGLAANWDYAQVILPSLLHGTVTTIQVFFCNPDFFYSAGPAPGFGQ